MIEVRNLRKNYGKLEALKGISFSIDEGEFYGLLGPNGAGKTTTISIISSILVPNGGEVSINGKNIYTHSRESKQIIGVVPQEIALYSDFSAMENLIFWGGLYGVPDNELKRRAKELLQMVGLSDRANDKVSSYSGGMKRRINIAAALLHRPKVLFMDEPTVGIDPQSRNLIFEVLEKLHHTGMTIIYTTHYMEEAERFCDRIGIIDHGQIIAQGKLDELRNDNGAKDAIAITLNHADERQISALQTFWPDSKMADMNLYFYSQDVKTDLPLIIRKCSEAETDIRSIEIQKTNLETIFLNLTGRQLRD